MRTHSRRDFVTPGEIELLLAACSADPSLLGRRDAAVIYLLATLGLPARIVAGLRLTDVQGSNLRASADCAVPLHAEGDQFLAAWILVRGSWPGPLFAPLGTGRAILRRQLSATAITLTLKRRCKKAGVPLLTASDLIGTRAALASGEWRSRPSFDFSKIGRIDDAAEGPNAALRWLRRLPSGRRRTATKLLKLFSQHLPVSESLFSIRWESLTPPMISHATGAVSTTYSRRTAHQALNCVQSVLRELQ